MKGRRHVVACGTRSTATATHAIEIAISIEIRQAGRRTSHLARLELTVIFEEILARIRNPNPALA